MSQLLAVVGLLLIARLSNGQRDFLQFERFSGVSPRELGQYDKIG